jgi:hypothetical protein
MGMFDTVVGIPDGYDDQFKCWDSAMESYQQGDAVPSVGIAKSYSVQLNTEGNKPPRFLVVIGNKITDPCAPDPATGYPVFDKWGSYLGHGSQMVKRPKADATEMVKDRLKEVTQTGVWTVKDRKQKPVVESPVPESMAETITHQLRLRLGFTVKLKLPVDLTEEEAERLSLWVQALPFS